MGECISRTKDTTDTELDEESANVSCGESWKQLSICPNDKSSFVIHPSSQQPMDGDCTPSGSSRGRFEMHSKNVSRLKAMTTMENLEMLFCLSGSRKNTEVFPPNELTEIVTELHKSGALDDENYLAWENENNETPLEIAIKAGNKVMVGTLLETGNNDMRSDAFRIACNRGNMEIVELLLSNDAYSSMDVHEKSDSILICAKHGYLRLLTKLHMKGFPLVSADKFTTLKPAIGSNISPLWAGRTDGSPLHVAAGNGQYQVMVYLMQQEMEIESGDSSGRKPLHHAVQGGLRCLRSLLQSCADIEAADNNGHSALFLASSFGNFAAVKLLVKWGAELDTTNDEGVSALLAAASSNHDRIVKYLLDEGAIFRGMLPEKSESPSNSVLEKFIPKKSMSDRVREANYATLETLEDHGNVLPAARIKLHIGITPEIIMSEAVQNGQRHVVKLLAELDSLENTAILALEKSSIKAHADIIMGYAFPKKLSQAVLRRALTSSIRSTSESVGDDFDVH